VQLLFFLKLAGGKINEKPICRHETPYPLRPSIIPLPATFKGSSHSNPNYEKNIHELSTMKIKQL